MKLSFPYTEGDRVIVYKDWENEKFPIGAARLIQHVKSGRSFILKETMPESSQIVYSYEEWTTDLGIHRIRYVDSIGLTNSADDEFIERENIKLPVDNFITINGIEIF